MFLFKATNHSNNGPRIVVDELIKAAARGVEVTVVLEKSGYDEGLNEKNTGAAERLRRHQIRVLYDSPARTNHVKAVIIDATYTFVGSHNFTYSAFSRNHELSLLVRDREMAARLIAYIEGIADAP